MMLKLKTKVESESWRKKMKVGMSISIFKVIDTSSFVETLIANHSFTKP